MTLKFTFIIQLAYNNLADDIFVYLYDDTIIATTQRYSDSTFVAHSNADEQTVRVHRRVVYTHCGLMLLAGTNVV